MRVVKAHVENFKCFRGRHDLALEPGVHAVTAEYEHDAQRSNWGGKSTLLLALGPFPLFGRHGERVEDDWITHGESSGGVQLTLEGGIVVERYRTRGGPTSLVVALPSRSKPLTGDDAQRELEAELGLTEDDFVNWSSVEQKQMDRFVIARPSDRQKVVSGWLQLAPLEEAGAYAKTNFGQRLLSLESAQTKARTIRDRIRELEERRPDLDEPALVRAAKEAADVAAAARSSESIWKAWRAKQDAFEGSKRASDAVQAEVDEAKRWLEEPQRAREGGDSPTKAASVLAAVKAKLEGSNVAVRARAQIAQGKFEGRCPVSQGFACPATDAINARLVENSAALTKEQKAQAEAKKAVADAERAFDEAQQRERRNQAADREEAVRRERSIRKLPDLLEEAGPEPAVVLSSEVSRLEQEAQAKAREVAAVAVEREQIAKLKAELERADAEVGAAQAEADAWRAASQILGRSGAQRRIAEGGLLKIEAGANHALAQAGVDLRVTTSWARPTNDLADACQDCGCAFPKSTKVKRCERCGSTRGPKMRDELGLELSNVSGAARELAGLAYQLSAGAFMRRRRGSRWSVMYFDEPFASLDQAHSRQLAQYVATALSREHAVEQAFVVAHSRAVSSAMPGQLLVRRSKAGDSTVEVVAS